MSINFSFSRFTRKKKINTFNRIPEHDNIGTVRAFYLNQRLGTIYYNNIKHEHFIRSIFFIACVFQ